MILKYDVEISSNVIIKNLERKVNEIYKLLPSREEGVDWVKPLDTIIEEIAGMSRLFNNHRTAFFSLLCKLEGLYTLQKDKDYFLFRRTIFECLNILGGIIKTCQ